MRRVRALEHDYMFQRSLMNKCLSDNQIFQHWIIHINCGMWMDKGWSVDVSMWTRPWLTIDTELLKIFDCHDTEVAGDLSFSFNIRTSQLLLEAEM